MKSPASNVISKPVNPFSRISATFTMNISSALVVFFLRVIRTLFLSAKSLKPPARRMALLKVKISSLGISCGPGAQEIPSDEIFTLSKAILRAGGFSDFADKNNVRITRKKNTTSADEIFIVNVALILEKGFTGLDMTLEAGDFIYVPERSIRF